MSGIFLRLLNLSISASWLVLAVLALRLVLKRAPKWVNVLLWGMVALRLMLPFSIESALSLIPSAETVSPEVVQFDPAPTITSGVEIIDNAVNPSLSESFAATPEMSVNPLYVWTEIAGVVWLIGLAAMLLYALVSYLRLRRRVRASIRLRENVYVCDDIASPFILGVAKPRIYLPSAMEEAQQRSVLLHEWAHLARHDHWWKPLGFALLAVYWFDPLLWLAYVLLCRDIELACDERVLRGMDVGQIRDYSSALLACSVPRRMIAACPLAFGEVGVGERVKNALRYKKPAFWVVAVSVVVCAVVAVCFLTNPERATMKWAKELRVEDVARIELFVMPQAIDKQYEDLDAEEIAEAVALINKSGGWYVRSMELLAGGSIELYVTTTDGVRHTVVNNGNVYLCIDGDAYRNFYIAWPYTGGDSPLPEDFPTGDAQGSGEADRVYVDDWSICLVGQWLRNAGTCIWWSDSSDAYLGVVKHTGLAEDLTGLQSMGFTVEELDGCYRCVTQEGLSNTVVYLYPAPSGESYYRVETHWSYDDADESEAELRARQLRTMAESFRFEEGGAEEDLVGALLARAGFGSISSYRLGTGANGRELALTSELILALQDAAQTLKATDASAAFGSSAVSVSFKIEESPVTMERGVQPYEVFFTSGSERRSTESKELYLYLCALGDGGYVEVHDLDDDGCCEALRWASANNRRNIVIYAARDGRVEQLDVNETLGCIASDYTGLIANLPREYKNLINAIYEPGKGGELYRYRSGALEYVATLDAALGGTASVTGYAAYDALLADIADLRRSGASDIETDFSSDLLAVNDYYQSPGWLLRDLDGDGTPELLLGADWGDGHTVILNIYRLDGAKAVRVVDGWSRSRWYLCTDGSLAHEGSDGASKGTFSYYRYEYGLLHHLKTLISLDGWFCSDTTDHYVSGEGFRAVSEEEANAMMSRYVYETLTFTPFEV